MNYSICTHAADKTVRGRQRRPDEAAFALRGSVLFSLPTLVGTRLAHTGGMRATSTPLPLLANGEGDSPLPRESLAA